MEKYQATMTRRGLVLDTNAEELAMMLKTYRLRQNLTQEELAEKWGCSRYTILRLERCRRVAWETTYKIFNNLVKAVALEDKEEGQWK